MPEIWNIISFWFLSAKLYWLVHRAPDLWYTIFNFIPSSCYCVTKTAKPSPSRDEPFNYMLYCVVCLLICSCLIFKLAILFYFTPNATTSLVQPTPGKQADDGITVTILSTNSRRKLNFFLTNHHFHFSLFTLNLLTPMFLSKLLVSLLDPLVFH